MWDVTRSSMALQVVVAATCGLEGADKVLPYMPAVDEALGLATHKVLVVAWGDDVHLCVGLCGI